MTKPRRRNSRGQFVKATGAGRPSGARAAARKRKGSSTRGGPGQLGAASMRRRYGARALQVAARLRNLSKTTTQRAHWNKVILELEAGPRRKGAKRNPAAGHPYRYLVSQAGAHLARFLTKAHAIQYARALANATGRQVRVTA